jgi:hypothetical protein
MHRLRRVAALLFAAFLLVMYPPDWDDILAENFGIVGEQYAHDSGRGRGSLEDIANLHPAGYQDAPWFE